MSLKMGILGLLRYSPLSGYSLKKAIDMSIAFFWPANLSQIYRELGALELEGFVVSDVMKQDARPDKKVYAITKRGAEAFGDWINAVPEVLEQPHRSEFMLRIFFASAMDGRRLARSFESMIDRIEEYKDAVSEEKIPEFLALFSDRSESASGAGRGLSRDEELMYWKFTIKRFQLTAEATIRWAEECVRTLEERK